MLPNPLPYFEELKDPRRETKNKLHKLSDIVMIVLWAVEIPAIPDWLSLLDIAGAVVSIEAMGCQKALAQTIVEAKADYVLALKDNHKERCEDVRLWLETETAAGRLPLHETVEKNHVRLEIRRYGFSARIDWLEQKPEWKGLAAVGRVESTRIIGDKTSVESRYYLCSFTDRSGMVCPEPASALVHRKPTALGAGRTARGGRQPGQERSFPGKLGVDPANGVESVQ
jgi:predicted transposase YbfD/YdcC